MNREQRETQERRIARLFAGLEREISTPPEQDLRSIARNASSQSRPLPSPAGSRRWPLQAGWTGALVIALVVAIGLGVGLGALIAPSGTAAGRPKGVGFLPEPGWFVLQSGPLSVPGQPAVAIAANVPFHPDDDVRGLAESSALPYATLQTLPPRGVVIAAAFSPRGENQFADPIFPRKSLPLDVSDAVGTRYGRALRDGKPLGQYQLRAAIYDQNVDLMIYFGQERPSRAHLDEAQRQLAGLLVRSPSGRAPERLHRALAAASRVVDRTVVCPITPGGLQEIDVAAQSGTRLFGDHSKWKFRPGVSFGDPRSQTPTAPHVSAGIVAGWPPTSEPGRPPNPDSLSYSVRCRPTKALVRLSTAGLSGGPASPLGDEFDCGVPEKVVVRLKAVFRDPTSIRRKRTQFSDQFVARGAVRESSLAISTPSGNRVAFASAHESGRARLFVGSSCEPSG